MAGVKEVKSNLKFRHASKLCSDLKDVIKNFGKGGFINFKGDEKCLA